jgi:hypothetical protein
MMVPLRIQGIGSRMAHIGGIEFTAHLATIPANRLQQSRRRPPWIHHQMTLPVSAIRLQ